MTLTLSAKEHHERFYISEGTLLHFFNVGSPRGVTPIIKRREYDERVNNLLHDRIEEIKQRYGGNGKTVEIRVKPYAHVIRTDELIAERERCPYVFATQVIPEIEKAWKDFDIYITVKEVVE